jgi:hypothetical protein
MLDILRVSISFVLNDITRVILHWLDTLSQIGLEITMRRSPLLAMHIILA